VARARVSPEPASRPGPRFARARVSSLEWGLCGEEGVP